MKKFIALVLSLVMALSLCAPAWGAEEVTVGDAASSAAYQDLATAITAAGDGGTVKVLSDIAFDSAISITKSVTIKADNPVEITSNVTGNVDAIAVTSGATLTLGENVTITSTNGAVLWAEGGKIIVDGAVVNVTGGSYSAACAKGSGSTIELKSGSFNQSGVDKVTVSIKGAGASLVMSGGAITSGGSSALIAYEGGTATISGGTVTSANSYAAYACDGGSITVSGGTVTNNVDDKPALVASKTYGTTGGNVTVESGTVKGVKAHEVNTSSAVIEGGNITGPVSTANGATLSITGGTFAVDPTPYVAEGYKAFEIVEADGGGYFVAVPYDVTFDANGGNGVLTQAPVPAGQFTLPTEHPFTREGYTFKGWATDKNATKVLGATYNVTGDVTFYAIWEEEECTGDSHVKVLVEYSGDVATKVYCDYCSMSFAFIQGTEDDAKDKFGEGNYVNAENDVWYTLKAQSGEVPSVPEVPPVEDDKTEGEEVAVTTPAEVDTVVNNTVIEAVKDSAETTVTVTTPVEGNADAETTIKFDSAEAKDAFVNATATDITTSLTAVEAPVTDEVTAKVEDKVSDDAELAAYLDIDITVFADGDPVGEITQLPKEIKVVIPASALDFGDLEKNHTRKVSVIRFHDDQVDVIPAKLEADGSVSFYSHLFSTYAVVYEDVATSTNYPIYYWPVGGTTTTDEDIKSPETFDAGIALYVGMSVAAAVGTVTLSKKRED